MRRFHLVRTMDVSGTSGVGRVADGIQFSNGTAVISWNTTPSSIATYGSVEDIESIHGHNGATTVQFVD